MLQGSIRHFQLDIVNISCIVLNVQDNGTYILGLDDFSNTIDLFFDT